MRRDSHSLHHYSVSAISEEILTFTLQILTVLLIRHFLPSKISVNHQ